MRPWIVVSYYTVNTLYAEHARGLIESLKRLRILYRVDAIESLGDWWKNTKHKPTFLRRMLRDFEGSDVVWVDCDAEFKRYPTLFDELDCDVAVHEFDRSNWSKGRGTEVLSGTVFLRNNERVRCLVEEWERRCQKSGRVWDQKVLEKVLAGDYYRLPGEYCKIFNRMKKVKNPVIVHYQASRTVRKNEGRLT